MDVNAEYRSVVASESARFVEILQAGPLDARVPGCPEWNLGQLGIHMAEVQQWSANVLRTGTPDRPDWTAPDPNQAAAALAESTPVLLAELDASDPAEECWNWGPGPQLKSFWFRRQALEVVCHRWDAESAISDNPPALDPQLAADAIDELLHVMLPRVAGRDEVDLSTIGGDVHVHVSGADADSGAPGEWTVEVADGMLRVTAEHRKSAVAIRGEASNLALFLYNRVGADSVEMFGDDEVWSSWAPLFQR